MQQVFQMAQGRLLHATVGSRVQAGRWWCQGQRGLAILPDRTGLLALILFLGWKKKWWTYMNQTPLFKNRQEVSEIQEEAESLVQGDGDGLERDDNADDIDGDGIADPGAADERMGVAKSRGEVNKMRKKHQCTMKFAALGLARPRSRRLFAGLCNLLNHYHCAFAKKK